MGILDDAIRQHLELKRQHGAEATDLDRLEQEAFGPAARPGDPEFETRRGSRRRRASPSCRTQPIRASSTSSRLAHRRGSDDRRARRLRRARRRARGAAGRARVGRAADPRGARGGDLRRRGRRSGRDRPRRRHLAAEQARRRALRPRGHRRPSGAEGRVAVGRARSGRADAGGGVDSGELETFAAPPSDAARQRRSRIRRFGRGAGVDRVRGAARRDRRAAPRASEAEDDESDEDLLEETPDFLKDAPDGEDLWFEQQARPKDFDFDD